MKSAENILINTLPKRASRDFQALCTLVNMPFEAVLAERGAYTQYVYFPISGFISLVETVAGSPSLEVGLVGHEGMLGAHVALSATKSPQHALVQGAGQALRIGASKFKRELGSNLALFKVMQRYLYVSMTQLATSSVCMRFHQLEPRLARWLLMSQDRAGKETFRMTHVFLGFMLGVRRVSITAAASSFADRGLISYRRGELTVIDRARLESAACSCYAADNKAYTEQFHKC